jgi:hypothetical protein
MTTHRQISILHNVMNSVDSTNRNALRKRALIGDEILERDFTDWNQVYHKLILSQSPKVSRYVRGFEPVECVDRRSGNYPPRTADSCFRQRTDKHQSIFAISILTSTSFIATDEKNCGAATGVSHV